jgi:hypothetical protein
MQNRTKTQSAEIELQHSMARWVTQLEFIHRNRNKLESLDLRFGIFGEYVDFDNLQRPELLAVIKAFPGTWNKHPTYDNTGITYTLAEPVCGLTIRCYNGEAPPSCVIEETVEYVTVPERIERKVTRKVKCPEPMNQDETARA